MPKEDEYPDRLSFTENAKLIEQQWAESGRLSRSETPSENDTSLEPPVRHRRSPIKIPENSMTQTVEKNEMDLLKKRLESAAVSTDTNGQHSDMPKMVVLREKAQKEAENDREEESDTDDDSWGMRKNITRSCRKKEQSRTPRNPPRDAKNQANILLKSPTERELVESDEPRLQHGKSKTNDSRFRRFSSDDDQMEVEHRPERHAKTDARAKIMSPNKNASELVNRARISTDSGSRTPQTESSTTPSNSSRTTQQSTDHAKTDTRAKIMSPKNKASKPGRGPENDREEESDTDDDHWNSRRKITRSCRKKDQSRTPRNPPRNAKNLANILLKSPTERELVESDEPRQQHGKSKTNDSRFSSSDDDLMEVGHRPERHAKTDVRAKILSPKKTTSEAARISTDSGSPTPQTESSTAPSNSSRTTQQSTDLTSESRESSIVLSSDDEDNEATARRNVRGLSDSDDSVVTIRSSKSKNQQKTPKTPQKPTTSTNTPKKSRSSLSAKEALEAIMREDDDDEIIVLSEVNSGTAKRPKLTINQPSETPSENASSRSTPSSTLLRRGRGRPRKFNRDSQNRKEKSQTPTVTRKRPRSSQRGSKKESTRKRTDGIEKSEPRPTRLAKEQAMFNLHTPRLARKRATTEDSSPSTSSRAEVQEDELGEVQPKKRQNTMTVREKDGATTQYEISSSDEEDEKYLSQLDDMFNVPGEFNKFAENLARSKEDSRDALIEHTRSERDKLVELLEAIKELDNHLYDPEERRKVWSTLPMSPEQREERLSRYDKANLFAAKEFLREQVADMEEGQLCVNLVDPVAGVRDIVQICEQFKRQNSHTEYGFSIKPEISLVDVAERKEVTKEMFKNAIDRFPKTTLDIKNRLTNSMYTKLKSSITSRGFDFKIVLTHIIDMGGPDGYMPRGALYARFLLNLASFWVYNVARREWSMPTFSEHRLFKNIGFNETGTKITFPQEPHP